MEPHSGLNNLDYIVIGIVVLSGLLALMRGLVREIVSLCSWVGAYYASTKFYPLALPTAHHYIKSDKPAEWAAMAAVFLIALIVLMIIGGIMCSFIKGRALTAVDRSLGFLYGVLRGALVVSLIYLGVVTIMWPDIDQTPAEQALNKDRNTPPELLLQARTRPLLAFGADKVKFIVPQEMIDEKLKDAEAQMNARKKAAQQEALDRLSTPAPRPTPSSSVNENTDLAQPIDQENKP